MTSTCKENMAICHKEGNIHFFGMYRIASCISSTIRSSFLVEGFPALFAHQRKVHSFDLAKNVFLRRTVIVPYILSVAKSVENREQAVSVCHKLKLFHEVSGHAAKSLVVIYG